MATYDAFSFRRLKRQIHARRNFCAPQAYGTPRKRFETIPVTSKQLKVCCLTFPKIRFNAPWDFIQAKAGSRDIDSLGWTDREFSCLDVILNHKREGHQGERCPGD